MGELGVLSLFVIHQADKNNLEASAQHKPISFRGAKQGLVAGEWNNNPKD